jgi:hypothetical protein
MGRPEYLQDVFGAMPVNTLNEDIYTSIMLGSDSVRVLTDASVYHPLPETEEEFRRQMTRWLAAMNSFIIGSKRPSCPDYQ